jgi:hypothetical protein
MGESSVAEGKGGSFAFSDLKRIAMHCTANN